VDTPVIDKLAMMIPRLPTAFFPLSADRRKNLKASSKKIFFNGG
jgi:hypothetical protein